MPALSAKIPELSLGDNTCYIVYRWRPLGDNNGNHRVVCIDKMEFDDQGLIKPVKITFEGVPGR